MFIPYKQLSRRLHKRIEKWLNLQSLKAKLLLCWSYYILVVVTEKLDGRNFFFFCKKLMFWFCFVAAALLSTDSRQVWLLFAKGSYAMRGHTFIWPSD